jgi:hypothetical protein
MRRCIAPGTATDYTNVNSLPGRNIGDGQVSERDDFQVQQGARVKEREDDGRHDCRLSENACNLN